MSTFSDAYWLKEYISASVLKNPKILGIGVGCLDYRQPFKGACLHYYVDKAYANSLALPKVQKISIKGRTISAPIKVIATGAFANTAKATAANFRRRIRPVPAGYSIGQPTLSGTAGLIVTDYPRRTRLFVCSNNHVLNRNNSSGYTPTIQPGGADGGTLKRDRIGRLFKFVKLRKNNNLMDAATAIPLKNSLLSLSYATVGRVPGHLQTYRVGNLFYKVGRTTGAVYGRVEAIHVDLKVDYSQIFPSLGLIHFRNQTVIVGSRPVSLAGDSGSVWLSSPSKYAAAINYAGSADGLRSISFPVSWFMQAFNTRVATPKSAVANSSVNYRKNLAYVRPLTIRQIENIPIINSK